MTPRDAAASIDALDWRDDRIVLDDIVLRLQTAPTSPELETQSIAFFKTRAFVDAYRAFFAARPEFAALRILELGIWDGGSVIFWNEVFRPERLVAVDLADRADDPLFDAYVASRGARDRIETHWQTDQRDVMRLRELAASLGGPLDLVVDDASHVYGPTKVSFETLFPLLRPGGIFVIEDWAWGHLPEYRAPDHPWRVKTPPTRLVHELVELQGSAPGIVASVTVNHCFVAIERGADAIEDAEAFALEHHIARIDSRESG